MTTPDHLHRLELTFELPGTPEQVWHAIATGPGITSWFVRTDVEERVGGAVLTHMGDTDMPGTVTGYDAPHRFVYEEPDWAALTGHDGATTTPIASEFLIEAASGGTCVLRVVTSAYGTGADWEHEFFGDMERGWVPFFERLRLYLLHYPGQHATPLAIDAQGPGPHEPVAAAILADLGVEAAGQSFAAHDLAGVVEQLDDDTGFERGVYVLLRLTDPMPGLFGVTVWSMGEAGWAAAIVAQFFSDAAPAYVAEHEARWKTWLESVAGSVPVDR